MSTLEHTYKVVVDDNFHYMDERERYQLAEFDCCEAATTACMNVVDDYLLSNYRPGMTAEQLYTSYTTFGEDPFIVTTDEQCAFSAWDYARRRCAALCVQKET